MFVLKYVPTHICHKFNEPLRVWDVLASFLGRRWLITSYHLIQFINIYFHGWSINCLIYYNAKIATNAQSTKWNLHVGSTPTNSYNPKDSSSTVKNQEKVTAMRRLGCILQLHQQMPPHHDINELQHRRDWRGSPSFSAQNYLFCFLQRLPDTI